MLSKISFRAKTGAVAFVAILCSLILSVVQAAEWQVRLEVTNGTGLEDTVYFGVHPEATTGIDPALGEVGLPPWPPSALFEVRFVVPGSEGVALDLRDTTHTQRFHTLKWQPGSGGYPVTIKWDRTTLPYASLFISDGYGGVFIPPVNMYEADSIQIPVSMSYIKQMLLDVTPGVTPGAEPEISGIPDGRIFAGQQFPEYHLNDYVFDPDTPDNMIDWSVTDNQFLFFEIDENNICRIKAPPGWTGNETVTFTAWDPQLHTDQAQVTFSVVAGGLPSWTIPLTVRNAAQESRTLYFGIDPEGSNGIDPDMGEIELPPKPPLSVFDARFIFPDDETASILDIRQSTADLIQYHLVWQAGAGGYPVFVEWPAVMPLGQFRMRDDLDGSFIPEFDMADSTRLSIPDSQVSGLFITVNAVVDTTPPQGPDWLITSGEPPLVSVFLEWQECIEPNFAYYEILFDTTEFDTDASFVWDWTEDAALMDRETESTTVLLPFAAPVFRFRIRAWDVFGNVSPVSNIAVTGIQDDQKNSPSPDLQLLLWPNPVYDQVNIWYSLGESREAELAVYDVSGRLVIKFHLNPSSERFGQFLWNGRNATERRISSGFYFLKLTGKEHTVTKKVLFLR